MEGYDAKFDPPLEKRLECPICLLAQREPMQTPCGHRFCSMCILRALRETGPRCPVDNTRVSHQQLFKDNFAKREVLSLNVRCGAEEFGCKWSGELRDLDLHTRLCELVTIDCYNSCGHNCHRKDLCVHLPLCPNKPRQCSSCGIQFVENKFEEHGGHCSNIMLPDSLQSTLFKAGDVLKWSGYLKMKNPTMLSQQIQVTAYLTAKSESDESYMFTGNWSSSLNLMPLNLAASKIFWRMLRGPEVQPKFFGFGLLSSDTMTSYFSRMLRRKNSDLSAAVCLHLKPGPSRPDLTIIYFHWNEQKKRLMACVAELKSHLVRQIQSRLQILQQTARRGRHVQGNHDSQSGSSRDLGQAYPNPHLHRSHTHPHPHPSHPSHPHMRPPPPPPPPPATHIVRHPHDPSSFQHHVHHHHHPHIAHPHHPSHPHPPQGATAVAVVTHHNPHHHHQAQHHAAAQAQGPGGLSNLLSWRMSQSINPIPWRMQPGAGVPFFTFPSTPPQFLPANPYPYTFAPLPAPPFSINPIPPVVPTSAVPIPSYAGIAVPQVTAVEPITGPTFPVALADPGDGLSTIPAGAVAVTLSGTPNQGVNPGQNTAAMAVGINSINVIQQPVIQQAGPSQADVMGPSNRSDVAVIHTLRHTVHPQHFQSAQITPATLIQTENGSTVAVVSSRAAANHENASEHFTTPVVAVQVPGPPPPPSAPQPPTAGPAGLIPVDPQNGGNIINVHVNPTTVNPPTILHPSQQQQQQQLHQPVSLSTSSRGEVVQQEMNDESNSFDGSSFPLSPYPVSSSPSSTSSSPSRSPTSSRNTSFNSAPVSINLVSPVESDTSEASNSPENFPAEFYNADNFSPFDSDTDTPPSSMNRSSLLYGGRDLSNTSGEEDEEDSSSSDQEEMVLGSSSTTGSRGRSDLSSESSQTSALHTLANAATSVIQSEGRGLIVPTDPTTASANADDDRDVPMRLPVLINLSDSETESRVNTPTSIIDLTNSPMTSSPSVVSIETNSATPTPLHPSHQQLINQATQTLQDTVRSLAPAVVVEHHHHHDHLAQPLLVPVIQQQRSSGNTHQGGVVEMPGQSSNGHASHHQHHRNHGNSVAMETNGVPPRSRRVLNFNTHPNNLNNVPNHATQSTLEPNPHLQTNAYTYTDYPPQNQQPPPTAAVPGGPPPGAAIAAPSMLSITTPAVLSADGSLAANSVSLGHRNLHVLGWQAAYDQSEAAPSHHHVAAAVPGHIPTQAAYHAHQQAVGVVNRTAGSGGVVASGGGGARRRMQGHMGNFWETVLPSLDMSMQSATNETTHN